MGKRISNDEMKYVIRSIIEYAYKSIDDEKAKPTDFNKGRKLAYHEVLDTIYNQLNIYKQDPKNFGYPDDWEKPFFSK